MATNTNFENYKDVSPFTELRFSTLSKNIELELLNSPQSFSFFFSSLYTLTCFYPFFLLYNLLLLHINRLKLLLCEATDLIIKYCSNYLSRNISLEIYFDCFIYERHEIFILSERLTKTNLVQTLIELAKMKCWSSSNWYFQHQSQISKYLE